MAGQLACGCVLHLYLISFMLRRQKNEKACILIGQALLVSANFDRRSTDCKRFKTRTLKKGVEVRKECIVGEKYVVQ